VLFGLITLVTRWTARSFAVFAVLLLPFFGFNYWFHYEVPVLTSIGMLDFAGNVTMLVLAIIGWRAARAEEAQA
jgi:NADPH-dependent 7-cyano-7-deazaguanine reductase QueF-like protein